MTAMASTAPAITSSSELSWPTKMRSSMGCISHARTAVLAEPTPMQTKAKTIAPVCGRMNSRASRRTSAAVCNPPPGLLSTVRFRMPFEQFSAAVEHIVNANSWHSLGAPVRWGRDWDDQRRIGDHRGKAEQADRRNPGAHGEMHAVAVVADIKQRSRHQRMTHGHSLRRGANIDESSRTERRARHDVARDVGDVAGAIKQEAGRGTLRETND